MSDQLSGQGCRDAELDCGCEPKRHEENIQIYVQREVRICRPILEKCEKLNVYAKLETSMRETKMRSVSRANVLRHLVRWVCCNETMHVVICYVSLSPDRA